MKVWRGDTAIAQHQFINGYRDWHGDFNSMFDNRYDSMSMYHSLYCSGERGVQIVFKEPVKFEDLKIFIRPECCRHRYKSVCIHADGQRVGCTPRHNLK